MCFGLNFLIKGKNWTGQMEDGVDRLLSKLRKKNIKHRPKTGQYKAEVRTCTLKKVSQGIVATRVRCGEIFNDISFYYVYC